MQTGLLLSHSEQGQPRATLTQNAHGRFEDRWIRLKLTPGQCAFVREATEIELPIAHGEGRFIVDSPTVLDELEQSQRITCQYVNELGKTDGFPVNPNGSERGIAGICDDTGRVFALMPHPERHLTPFQHPTWTRRETQPEHGDGFYFFHNAVQFFS
jgi:phosphoribosylformylglycinamidine synthase